MTRCPSPFDARRCGARCAAARALPCVGLCIGLAFGFRMPAAAQQPSSTNAAPPETTDAGPRTAGPFARNTPRVSVVVGSGSTRSETYLILGAGFGYFIIDGLELGLDYEAWILGSPVMHRLSPEARYVFHFVPILAPYVGLFYRHSFVAHEDDLDQLGMRVGAYYVPASGRMYIGGGVVYERLLACTPGVFVDCDVVYPEISFAIPL